MKKNKCGTCHYFRHPFFLECCWSSIPEVLALDPERGVYKDSDACDDWVERDDDEIAKEAERLRKIKKEKDEVKDKI